jgi:hypothetical protein
VSFPLSPVMLCCSLYLQSGFVVPFISSHAVLFPLSPVRLCHSLNYVYCFFALRNDTVFILLNVFMCFQKEFVFLSFYGLWVYCKFNYRYLQSTCNPICVLPCKWILMSLCVVFVVGRTSDLYCLGYWHLFSPWTISVCLIMFVSGHVGHPTLTSVAPTVFAVCCLRPSKHLLCIWLSLWEVIIRNQYVLFDMLLHFWEIWVCPRTYIPVCPHMYIPVCHRMYMPVCPRICR